MLYAAASWAREILLDVFHHFYLRGKCGSFINGENNWT